MGHKEGSTRLVYCWGLLRIDTVAKSEPRVLKMPSTNMFYEGGSGACPACVGFGQSKNVCLSFSGFLKYRWELLPGVCMDCMCVLESDAECSRV